MCCNDIKKADKSFKYGTGRLTFFTLKKKKRILINLGSETNIYLKTKKKKTKNKNNLVVSLDFDYS